MSDSETTVILVRHGEVAEEHKGTFYGCADVPLSEEGEIGSPLLAAKIVEDEPPDAIYCSPLERTMAVAEPLAAVAGLDIVQDPDFRELDRGSWVHLSHEQLEQQSPGAIKRYLDDPENGNAPDGEKESVFTARVWGALDRVLAAHPGERVVVVTHGHVIRVCMRRVLGWDVATSFQHFMPYHALVEMRLRADGSGEVVRAPDGHMPLALRYGQGG